LPVRDDVENLTVRVTHDLGIVEGSGWDLASLEQDPLPVPTGVVARLTIDRVALAAAFDKRVVHGLGDRRD
jgi:hypothetical protein